MHFRPKEVPNTVILSYGLKSQYILLQYHKVMIMDSIFIIQSRKKPPSFELSGSLELRKTGVFPIIFYWSTK